MESARRQLRWLPKSVETARAEVADLKQVVERPEGVSLVARLAEGREEQLKAELEDLCSQLSDDVRSRGLDSR